MTPSEALLADTVSRHEIEDGPSLLKSPQPRPNETPARKTRLRLAAEWAWFAAIVGLFALHAVHLRADFPNYSPWMDYAKYTDEGWYGNGAIEAFVRGSWYVPGDFNTAVALPVWPFLEWLLFHFTGVSVAAARGLAVAVFGGNLLLTYLLVRSAKRRGAMRERAGREQGDPIHHLAVEAGQAQLYPLEEAQQPRWVALLAATIVASSAFLYCFSRLAILEPLVSLLMLLAFLVALRLPARDTRPALRTAALVGIGLLICLMVLTKTTAVALLPAIFYLLWERHHVRRGVRSGLTAAVAAVLPLFAYYVLFVRPHYVEDFKYLFIANVYSQPVTVWGWIMALWYGVHGGLWMGATLFVVAGALTLLSTAWLRTLWLNKLFTACMIAVGCQLLFIGYHNNMQPRYYTVAAFPMAIAVALGLAELLRRQRIVGRILLGLLTASLVYNATLVVAYTRHPQYTFVTAAENLTRYIDRHPNGNRLLLSISGNDIGLITGMPAICDDFGTLDLPARIHRYQPGWYAAWNELDPGTLEDLHTQFKLQEVARFPAFDDEDRNVLILYKLRPLPLSKQKLDDAEPARETSGQTAGASD